MASVSAGARPIRPRKSSPTWKDWGLSEDIWYCMQRCWKESPEMRPDATEIVRSLTLISTMASRQDSRPVCIEDNFMVEFRRRMSGPIEAGTLVALGNILSKVAPRELAETREDLGSMPTPDPQRHIIDRPFSWPLQKYSQRQHFPMLFFDISHDPNDTTDWRGIRLLRPKNFSRSEPFLDEYKFMPACTMHPLTKINMRCTALELRPWDVVVYPPVLGAQIYVIDVFTAIYTTYHTSLTSEELEQHQSLVNSKA
ncbi:hypothetical protein H0H87_008183, partial [Tephrocybe sp. NHM501043]